MSERSVYGPLLEDHSADWRCYTTDEVLVTDGLRVWDYDGKPGTVSFAAGDPTREHWNGWFAVLRDDGSRSLMDGSRLRTRHWRDGRAVPHYVDEWLPAQLAATANGARHYAQDGERRCEVAHAPRVPTDPRPWLVESTGRRYASDEITTELPTIDDPTEGEPMDTTNTTGKRYVKSGDRVLVVLPASEAAMHLRVDDQVWTILVGDGEVRLIGQDGRPYSSPLTHGEAGVRHDDAGWWVEPLPATLYRVTRDGVPVSPPMTSEMRCEQWGLRHQGQSWHHATTHEGYAVQEIDAASLTPAGTEPPAYDVVGAIIAYEQGELDDDGVVTLFQHLVDTGMAWQLQGRIGRTARDMITAGLVKPPAPATPAAEDGDDRG